MHILDQLHYSRVNDDSLAFFAAIGVDYLALNPPPFAPMHRDDPARLESRGAMVDYLAGVKELAAAHGIALHNVALTGVDEISLARPGRDAAIAHISVQSASHQRSPPARRFLLASRRAVP